MNSTPTSAEAMQIAFDYVARVYRECSHLILDFHDQMDRKGFALVNSDYGTELSGQIRQPHMWMPRFLSIYWQPKKGGNKKVHVGITMAFFHPDNRAIQPMLIYGIARRMDDDRAVKPRMYLWFAGTGHDSAFTYSHPSVSPLQAPGQLVRFACTHPDTAYVWPKAGYAKAVPLDGIAGVDQVIGICGELKELWNQYSVKI